MVRLQKIADVADEFVRARLLRITGLDLNLFEFDYDLTWMVFFMNADGKVYGRYGGRDASDPDARFSLDGLRYAMQAALAAHRDEPQDAPPPKRGAPLFAESYVGGRKRQDCIHCHQVKEMQRAYDKSLGKWNRDDRWVYPLPDNLGLILEVNQGNHVRVIQAASPAAKAGLKAGDVVQTLDGRHVASFADAQYALHKAPAAGRIEVAWKRGAEQMTGELELAGDWRKTNLTWRPSLLDLLPSFTLYGDELTAAEKKLANIAPKSLAFRQQDPVPRDARLAGVRPGDVIVGVNKEVMEMSLEQFLGHMRRNFLVGDRITLNLVRGTERLDVALTLR